MQSGDTTYHPDNRPIKQHQERRESDTGQDSKEFEARDVLVALIGRRCAPQRPLTVTNASHTVFFLIRQRVMQLRVRLRGSWSGPWRGLNVVHFARSG